MSWKGKTEVKGENKHKLKCLKMNWNPWGLTNSILLKHTTSIFHCLQSTTLFRQGTCSRSAVFLCSVLCKCALGSREAEERDLMRAEGAVGLVQPEEDLAEAKAAVYWLLLQVSDPSQNAWPARASDVIWSSKHKQRHYLTSFFQILFIYLLWQTITQNHARKISWQYSSSLGIWALYKATKVGTCYLS